MNLPKKSEDYLNFFSIVIPAHNEEKIIEKTLTSLKKIDYPPKKYEVVVIENGSSDQTYKKAKKFESNNFRIYASRKRGVSRARNLGINKASPELDWCIVMDADTFLKPNFLKELNRYINRHPNVHFGTTTILPFPKNLASRFWFFHRNVTDCLGKCLHVIHIIKKDILFKEKYDEELHLWEDQKYARALARHGKYFFMRTKNVLTSARRFEKVGWIKMFFINIYYGNILPEKIRKRRDWKVIR